MMRLWTAGANLVLCGRIGRRGRRGLRATIKTTIVSVLALLQALSARLISIFTRWWAVYIT